ncbi:snf7 family protein, putative [Ichthyophthirius multifiliis]|uniref:Snf7 family protein, putative n=1 Tax=Ichthyophthirius multifiliis TaxID=5932 RepID=G0R5X0_ICHMU|nr:snf7 family protein, putative [Ichthyophthirius multifiliis]EGR27147.1 snf7 family protein, putative [Ichthyophthirius multifiliis]|eukprot:XP_004024031.1 snf7 family protein, putative [Ichthyophthirius multifiliis]
MDQMSEEDRAVIDLKKVKDNLFERQKQIEQNMQQAQEQAKEFLKQKQQIRAKYALQRKKLYDNYLDNILQQDHIINKTIMQLKQTFDQKQFAETLKNASQLMKDINKSIDIDAIQEAGENLKELEINNQKFNELYQQYVGDEGDQEIQNDINQMEAELIKFQVENIPKANVNNNKVQENQQNIQNKQQNDNIDDQLAMLA